MIPATATGAGVDSITAHAFRIPTDTPESDGTLRWDSTTLVLVEAAAAGETGLGYTYAAEAAVPLITRRLAPAVRGLDAFDVARAWDRMREVTRNIGWPGLVACAASAVDTALWDLKAKLLGISLTGLFGARRDRVPVYGSGGFTSYPVARLCDQLEGWVRDGITRVKMKVGRESAADDTRVHAVRRAIGPDAELFVDANGAYTHAQALAHAEAFAAAGVTWFEEPVSSDDLEGLRMLRTRAPAGMAIAAGEYGYEPYYFRRMLEAGAVHTLQADVTRCGGYTGFRMVADLCEAWHLPLSTHTAPALHLPVALAAPRVVHVEWFHDHVRIERLLFDGFVEPQAGMLSANRGAHGHGLAFRRHASERYRA